MTLRRATEADLSEILQVFVKSIESTCTKDYTPEQIKAWTSSIHNQEKWLRRIQEQHFLVVESESSIAGFSSLEDNYLDLLFVHPDFQGKGAGHALVDALLETAKGKTLTTHASVTARTFFERKGFKVVRENTVSIDGVELTNFEMEFVTS